MKALVVLNEHPMGSHPDVYEAFESLVREGLLSGYDVIPFASLQVAGETDSAIVGRIRDALELVGHELVIWMHTGSLEVSEHDLQAITAGRSHPAMVYWEGDSYHPVFKPIPHTMTTVMSRCDQVYLPCGGPVVRTLRRAGVRDLAYAPSCASGSRFPHVWRSNTGHDHQIVVIGNRSSSKIPFKTMPGARRRRLTIERLVKRYGKNVAIYGRGWSGPAAMGPCAFDEQSAIYRSAVLTVGVNNSTYPYVFSNRLPIALASGIPILYNRNPGFDAVFPEWMNGTFFDEDRQLFGRVDALLDASGDELDAVSLKNREFFEQNLTRACVARFIVERARCCRGDAGARPQGPLWQMMPQLIGG